MRYSNILPLILISSLIFTACGLNGQREVSFQAAVQEIYLELTSSTVGTELDKSEWNYSYHPMIQAAWIYKGRETVSQPGNSKEDNEFSGWLAEGQEIFKGLQSELERQASEGQTSFDSDSYLALIEDDTIRESTSVYLDQEITPLNAFVRAYINHIPAGLNDAPAMIIRLLGQLYTEHPEACEFPEGQPLVDESTEWRDWLHLALAATGQAGVTEIIAWDNQLEGLQSLLPDEKFWDGRLTHAYTLRSLQLSRGAGSDLMLAELEKYREGGNVSGLHAWMYWNLAYRVSAGGGMFPYTDEQVASIKTLLEGGLSDGPVGEGEEFEVVADAMGRAPDVEFSSLMFKLASDDTVACEKKKVIYSALGNMLLTPLQDWVESDARIIEIRDQSKELIISAKTDCGIQELLQFYYGSLNAFYPVVYGYPEKWEFNHDQMIGINEAFRKLLPSMESADERMIALDLLLTKIAQPEFMILYDDSKGYYQQLKEIHDEWKDRTNFTGSDVNKDDFDGLMRLFRNQLGNEQILDEYFGPVDNEDQPN